MYIPEESATLAESCDRCGSKCVFKCMAGLSWDETERKSTKFYGNALCHGCLTYVKNEVQQFCPGPGGISPGPMRFVARAGGSVRGQEAISLAISYGNWIKAAEIRNQALNGVRFKTKKLQCILRRQKSQETLNLPRQRFELSILHYPAHPPTITRPPILTDSSIIQPTQNSTPSSAPSFSSCPTAFAFDHEFAHPLPPEAIAYPTTMTNPPILVDLPPNTREPPVLTSVCPKCGWTGAVNLSGKLRRHRRPFAMGGLACV